MGEVYGQAYKTGICKKVVEGGRTVSSVSREISIRDTTIYVWVSRYKENREKLFVGSGHVKPEDELYKKLLKKNKATTDSNHNLPVTENILNREHDAERPNQKWMSDITYVATDEGWLYLAGIVDLCGREVDGWAMGDRMTKDLVIRCLNQASGRRSNPRGVLIHSDRGSQHCSNDYQSLLKKYGFICSMSRKGNC